MLMLHEDADSVSLPLPADTTTGHERIIDEGDVAPAGSMRDCSPVPALKEVVCMPVGLLNPHFDCCEILILVGAQVGRLTQALV